MFPLTRAKIIYTSYGRRKGEGVQRDAPWILIYFYVTARLKEHLPLIGPCIANIFSDYNQQDATFLKFIYFCKTLYMFQICYLLLAAGSSNGLTCLTLYVQFCAPDDGRKNRLKHVERLTRINKFEKSCILLVVLWEAEMKLSCFLYLHFRRQRLGGFP